MDDIQGEIGWLSEEDSKHMIKVMRKQVGDQIEAVVDEKLYIAQITSLDKKRVGIELVSQLDKNPEPKVKITLFQGLNKGDKMELVIQKCVEIGVDKIVPVDMVRCVKKGVNLERWNKIAQQASCQSKRLFIPEVTESVSITDIRIDKFDLFLVPFELEETQSIKTVLRQHNQANNIGILIGPEGGIADEEIKLLLGRGAISVSLGQRILRTETAGLVSVAVTLFELGDME